jgi:hypothetical protein
MSHFSEDEDQVEYHSHEEALRLARSETLRNYEEHEHSISYIAYVAEFHDYCLCEFIREEAGWLKTFRALMPQERAPGEEIRHEAIVGLARQGNMVTAVRLYRSKHGVGLREALAAVQALL